MNCGFEQELLSMYADGTLKQEFLSRVETHVLECEKCRRSLRDMQEVGNALNSLPRERAPNALIERILTEAEGDTHLTMWDAVRRTTSAMWTTAKDGFTIEDDQEGLLRRELPVWVARWVLFV